MTPIDTLLDDARGFEGENVRIVGDVESPEGARGPRAYQLNDGTGSLRIVGMTEGSPRVGTRVGVEGMFRSAFRIGSEDLIVVVEKARFDP